MILVKRFPRERISSYHQQLWKDPNYKFYFGEHCFWNMPTKMNEPQNAFTSSRINWLDLSSFTIDQLCGKLCCKQTFLANVQLNFWKYSITQIGFFEHLSLCFSNLLTAGNRKQRRKISMITPWFKDIYAIEYFLYTCFVALCILNCDVSCIHPSPYSLPQRSLHLFAFWVRSKFRVCYMPSGVS